MADPTRRQRLRLLDPSRLNTRWVLLTIGLLTAVIQFVSASGPHDKTLEPLNAAQEIATNLAWKGQYYGGNWVRLKGVHRPEDPPLRAFNLPGYVWYLAATWRAVPQFRRYLQIPVVILLTVSVAWFAFTVGGPLLGLIAGLIATLDPFIVVHGPVWDDAVFGTAILWLIIAIAAHRWHQHPAPSRWPELIIVSFFAAIASLSRTEIQVLLVVLAVCVWTIPTLQSLRPIATSAIVATMIAVTAWGARNQQVIGRFLTGSTHDGITLWESNGPFARHALALGQVDRLSQDSSMMRPYWSQTTNLTEAGADAYFRREAVRYSRSNLGDVAQTALVKAIVSISGIRPEEPLSDRRNVVALVDNLTLLLLAAIALPLRIARPPARDRSPLILLAASAAVVAAFLLIGPSGIRYWLDLRPAAWVLAATLLFHGAFFPRALSTGAMNAHC